MVRAVHPPERRGQAAGTRPRHRGALCTLSLCPSASRVTRRRSHGAHFADEETEAGREAAGSHTHGPGAGACLACSWAVEVSSWDAALPSVGAMGTEERRAGRGPGLLLCISVQRAQRHLPETRSCPGVQTSSTAPCGVASAASSRLNGRFVRQEPPVPRKHSPFMGADKPCPFQHQR